MSFDNNFIDNQIKTILGPKFDYRVWGIGRDQTLEIEVPEEMASDDSKATYTSLTHEEQMREYKKLLAERGEEAANVWKEKMERMKEGVLRHPPGHPKEGEIRGDVRHLVLGDRSEDEIIGWLNLVKRKIAKEFEAKQKPVPNFGV
jgi:hypothetical protein